MTQYVLSLSYGKDSLACLGAVEKLGLKIDRIVLAELWATDTIPADLPPMMEFKVKADAIIKERWGIEVEHFRSPMTYEEGFYHKIRPETVQRRKEKSVTSASLKNFKYYDHDRAIWGFPIMKGAWCNSRLKIAAIREAQKTMKDAVQIIGIAADEPIRIERHKDKPNTLLPLVEVGWTEQDCMNWCIENDLLSPIYSTATRGGCWFCHNQGVNQLRLLRKEYPEYWELLLKWDKDSPTTFKPCGHGVADYDMRFQLEDEGLVQSDERWRWSMLNEQLNYRMKL